MSFTLSPELTPVLAKLLDRRTPIAVSRQGGPALPAAWPRLTEEVGLAGLFVDEGYGGQGATLRELGAAAYEAGRVGWSSPLVATAGVATELLRLIDPEDSTGLQAGLASGGRVVVTTLHEDDGGADLGLSTSASGRADTVTVSGRKAFVDSGSHAHTFLVPAVAPDGEPIVVTVPADAPGVTVEVMLAVDAGRGLAVVTFLAARGTVIPAVHDVTSALADAFLVGAVLTAADMIGAAGQCLDLSIEYAMARHQFGRAIATFQSVKHKLVDMFAELETARSAVSCALDAASAQAPDWRFEASAAKVRAGDAAMFVAREAVQVHGGIGFTYEHDLSHHFRRITTLRAMYGTPTAHRARVARMRGF